MHIMDTILSKIIWIALGSLGFILFLVYFLGEIITRPILKLINAFESIRGGDLNTHLDVDRKDEFGQLAIAFNEMAAGLRERVKLRSYVGEYTRTQVQTENAAQCRNIVACVLFSDIRNFTRFSVKKNPQKIIDMLNTWLGFQAELVKEYNGAIDKFVGDEIMAIFSGPDCVNDAIHCAEKIQERAQNLKEDESNI